MSLSSIDLHEVFCTPNETGSACGYGRCNTQGTFCECDDGYVHDFTQMMFPNCFLSQKVKIVLLSILAACGLFSGLVALF